MDVREKSKNDKRLIDANALIKEAYADGAYGYVDAEQIANAPTVDAVEVVRCKDCKRFHRNLENDTYCDCVGGLSDPEEHDFCSYGERRC